MAIPKLSLMGFYLNTSDEQDMRLGTSAYMASAAGKTSRILDTRPKVLISSTK